MTEIFRPLHSISDRIILQGDLNSIAGWVNIWPLGIKSNKSVAMHVNDPYYYTIFGVVLPKVKDYKSLGVMINSELKTTSKCKAATSKGFVVLCVT